MGEGQERMGVKGEKGKGVKGKTRHTIFFLSPFPRFPFYPWIFNSPSAGQRFVKARSARCWARANQWRQVVAR